MVSDQIEARGVTSPAVLSALRRIPRHLFVSEALIPRAHEDNPLAIGEHQTISQPYIVALMTQVANPDRDTRVLEIGTGSGYQAAVLASLAGWVYTVEFIENLARRAHATLSQLGFDNISQRIGDGWHGWKEQSPFDIIVVTCGALEIPPLLLAQLAPGGRLVVPVGEVQERQDLLLVTKDAQGRVEQRSLLPVRFVPLVRPAGDGA